MVKVSVTGDASVVVGALVVFLAFVLVTAVTGAAGSGADELGRAMKEGDYVSQASALRELGKSKEDAITALPLVIEALRGGGDMVKKAAIRVMKVIGIDGEDAIVPALALAIGDRSMAVAWEARSALNSLIGTGPEAQQRLEDSLVAQLTEGDQRSRIGAYSALERIAPHVLELIDVSVISSIGRPSLPETFPIAMAFRPLEGGQPMAMLAPIPILHTANNVEAAAVEGQWPEKLTILHKDYAAMWATNPDTQKVFPGHFLYWTGSKLTADLKADSSDNVVYVENTGRFGYRSSFLARARQVAQDIIIYALDDEGNPDWTHYEYAQITEIGTNYLSVRRAQIGTTPREYVAGKAVVAQHVLYCNDLRAWQLNLSLQCPRDPEGLTAAEWFARYYAGVLEKSGADGIEFDVGKWYHQHNQHNSQLDCNNDLVPDWGYIGGVNSFGLGGQLFAREFRRLVGDNKIFQADSSTPFDGYRGFDYVNGIEMESFPYGTQFEEFSEAFEHLRHWVEKTSAEPKFSYGFTKRATTVYGNEYLPDGSRTDFRFRIGLAANLMLGMPHPYAANKPAQSVFGESAGTFGVYYWDEYRGGDLDDWGWLGKPLGPARQYLDNLEELDVLDGAKWQVNVKRGYEAEVVNHGNEGDMPDSVNVTFIPEGVQPDYAAVRITAVMPTSVRLEPDVEYTIQFEARGDDSWDYMGEHFDNVPRLIWIAGLGEKNSGQGTSVLADDEWRTCTISYVADGYRFAPAFGVGEQIGETAVRNVRLYKGGAERWIREFENGIVLLNVTLEPWDVEIGEGYRRLRGTQDPVVNSGEGVGPVVTVPAWDALFLVRDKEL